MLLTRPGVLFAGLISLCALAATAALPAVPDTAILIPFAVLAIAWAVGLMLTDPDNRPAERLGLGRHRRQGRHTRLDAARELLLHLAPVGLLMVIYPIAAQRIDTSVGGTPLLTILLASSVTVPWLSQSACLPLYRAVGDLLPLTDTSDTAQIERRMVAAWPSTVLLTAPSVLLFAVPLQLVFGWSMQALGVYIVLAFLHLLFAQSVVLTNVARRRGLWALSWLAYAVAIFVVPTWWALPATLATLVQMWSLRHGIAALFTRGTQHLSPVALDPKTTWFDIIRGFLLGSVLWADKLLLFAATAGAFAVDVVYLAMLPVVLAYNYYFVRLAPGFDRDVLAVRHALENERFSALTRASNHLVGGTKEALMRTGAVAALLNAGIGALIVVAFPTSAALVVGVAIASWLFMAATLLGYKLDYVGRTQTAMAYGAAHLALAVLAFAFLPVIAAYVVLIVGGVVLVAAAARSTYDSWSSPAYTLFWRHATSW